MTFSAYPLLMQPALHPRIWGGRKLAAVLNKALPDDGTPYGETWEIHDTAVIANGVYAGQTLGDVARAYGAEMLGAGVDPALGVPLLAKFLDAEAWLSVQVHPNDEQAAALEGDPRGKTEAWIVLHAEPGAQLIIGVQPGTSREALAAAIQTGHVTDLLVYAPVTRGDVLFLAANTIHALGPGILIYEIQESSDLTYRLYDWGRLGLDGTPRALHIEKGVAVANTAALPIITRIDWDTPGDQMVIDCAYFRTMLHALVSSESRACTTKGRPHLLTCVEGEIDITLESDAGNAVVALGVGGSAFIPAAGGIYAMRAGAAGAKILRAW